MLAINSCISFVTGFSPFFAIHGYDIKVIKTKELLKTKGIIPIAKKETFIFKLKNVIKMAQTIMVITQEKYEIYANIYR
jgi:5'(3')-deoxyribonucleotidase